MRFRFYLLLLALLLSGCAVYTTPPTLPSLAPMLARVAPAVVVIGTEKRPPWLPQAVPEGATPGIRSEGLGSGVIIDAEQGHVVTNQHVIAGAVRIAVTLHDGRRFAAEIVGADADSDIAVLRIPAHDLSSLPLADSDKLRVGDYVVAIGNPFGLGQTATFGIVSALGRSGLGLERYEDFIQTDASINPGGSGGPLLDLQGELVGINTAILAPSGGNVGINFAIPVNLVERLVEQLVRHGQVRRGQLGIRTRDVNPDARHGQGLAADQGARVVRVDPDSAAAAAGLRSGDIVLAINGRTLKNAEALRNAIGLLPAGARIELQILRDGRFLELTARLGLGSD
ncbi:MAG: trypsin-like peptidase domain-containing protein [Candidatus Competibacterales bacterium]|nr:trypsin-like peptidase domain-containing protein [Candidatus Competibacterales bacterium]